MNKQEQNDQWHKELKILCKALIMSHDSMSRAKENGVKVDDSGEEFMNMFRQHFAKVSIKQNSEMDSILEYEDMLDYAKWYVSGEAII
jgi:hypothetical protein